MNRVLRRTRIPLAAVVLLATVILPTLVIAGGSKDFFQKADLFVPSNYNPNGVPTNTDDVRFSSSTLSLTTSSGNTNNTFNAESINVVNGLGYTVSNDT